jgi:hypothetical protein
LQVDIASQTNKTTGGKQKWQVCTSVAIKSRHHLLNGRLLEPDFGPAEAYPRRADGDCETR